MPPLPVVPSAIVVLVVGAILLARRADIRLVLLASATFLYFVHATQPQAAGVRLPTFAQVFVDFANGMINPKSVIPICSAMGFAYVCKFTGCDAHLVHLLLHPLRHVRWLLIPGGITVAFLVNSAIVSQTSTVAVVGPVLLPILLSAGISRVTAGSLLLLGGSMGGELLNPAAVEVAAIRNVTGVEATTIISRLLPYNLLASGTALLVFWMMAIRYERRRATLNGQSEVWGVGGEESIDVAAPEPGSIAASMSRSDAEVVTRINFFKALVPLVPIVLLLFVKRFVPLPDAFVTGKGNPIAEQTTIATAMLIGVVCAALSSPKQSGRIPAAFFEGAGFVYAHVISIITCATMFANAVQANGLIAIMTPHLENAPAILALASIAVPWLMACVTGTAVGTAPLVIQIILPIAMGNTDARTASPAVLATGVRIGAVNAIAAQFGRTSSPVAPVTIMCATLARTRPLDLVKRVTVPLVAGGVVLFVAAIIGSR